MNKSNYFFLLAFFAFLSMQVSAQQFFYSKEKPADCAAADGIVTLVPTRGVPPFTYAWSTGSTEVSLRNIPKGVYYATLTDATGATVVHTAYLNSKEFDVQLTDSKPVSFCNPVSGALTVTSVGGVAPYTYQWSNGMTGAAITGLGIGNYVVTVTDATGCVAEDEFAIGYVVGPYYPQAGINVVDKPDCINLSNGELSAYLIQSGYTPYTYSWSNGATTESIANLAESNYAVTVTDALGCSSTSSVYLNKKLNVTGSVICNGSNTGAASAQLVNATGPVTYAWSNGQSGPNLINLANGYYTVTASDAAGCVSTETARVAIPELDLSDYSNKCFSGNGGFGYCYVRYDQGVTYLWDNGETNAWNYTLSAGLHNITVTTALGCTVTDVLNIAQPLAPAYSITTNPTPADCSQGLGGAMNLNITGGLPNYTLYVSGANGFVTSDINSLQNLASGQYYINVNSSPWNCYASTSVTVPDASGFEPELAVSQIDCTTGYGALAVINANGPNVQYQWSNGATTSSLFNLTQGNYAVTVTGTGSCVRYFGQDLWMGDTLNGSLCLAIASGQLVNDQGTPGCSGTTGIPYQQIRTLPSGALNFTDNSGFFNVGLASGTFDLDAPQYAAGDIACPASGTHTVNAVLGQTYSGLDFHFLNSNPVDFRVRQRPLRTAQPGYPYSLRMDVCNDGASSPAGMLDFEYGNLLGSLTGHYFTQHPGVATLLNDTPGAQNNNADFSFPSIAPGTCELLQLDLQTGTSTAVGTEFITDARVTPVAGDPTPANNIHTLVSAVSGSFDPNSVLAYPARDGNPKDGGHIIRNQDNTITYQIFFQNTGNAPADLVIIRDSLDENLDISTIRNITASHDMKISTESDNKVLRFKFENIALPDSTTDYAGSIGSIQYQIDLKPGIALGTEIRKKAAIYFDFNPPVITNQNVLQVIASSKVITLNSSKDLALFPNPSDEFVGFYCDGPSTLTVFNAMGQVAYTQTFETGLQQVNTTALPNGMYLVRLDTKGVIRSGKLTVSH